MQTFNQDYINRKFNRVLLREDRMDLEPESLLEHLVTDLELTIRVLEITVTHVTQVGIEFLKLTIGPRDLLEKRMVAQVSLTDFTVDQRKEIPARKTENRTTLQQENQQLQSQLLVCQDNFHKTSNKLLVSKNSHSLLISHK